MLSSIKACIYRFKPLLRMLYALRSIQQKWRLWTLKRHHSIDPHLVMFDSFQSSHYNDSPKALYQELMTGPQYADYRAVWVLRDPDGMKDVPSLPRTDIVSYNSADYRRALVTAGIIVTNSMMPPYWKKRKGQILVQTWHGTPLKRLGCDITTDCNSLDRIKDTHKRYRTQAAQFDYMISPSAFCTEKLTSAFDLVGLQKQDIVIETGYPRNDRLCNATAEEVAEIRRRLQIPDGKRVVLYAPTYRDNQRQGQDFVYTPPVDFSKLIEAFGDEVVWLFRAHYFVANQIDFSLYGDKVRNVGNIEDINDLYLVTDLLITDYSSVFFDYAILRRPVLFYMYDREEYQHQLRDFYLDLSALPGPIIETEDKLAPAVNRLLSDFKPDEHYEAFCQRFCYLEDGNASHRVWKTILP